MHVVVDEQQLVSVHAPPSQGDQIPVPELGDGGELGEERLLHILGLFGHDGSVPGQNCAVHPAEPAAAEDLLVAEPWSRCRARSS